MREYVVLIVGDPDRWWTTMSQEERAAGYAEYTRFDEELTRRGHEVSGGAELHGTATARRIAAGGGPVTDGPFTESTEQVGGFYQVRTADLDDLLECCQIIAKLGDGIEVRPVVTSEDRS
jgi:hypothetical protein